MDYPQNLSVPDRYWFDIIQQCRTSGKSDYQWLLENNIKSPTFYYHVKQLRKKACEIPKAARASKAEVQEVVPVFFKDEEALPSAVEHAMEQNPANAIAVRLQVHGICMEITNAASAGIIQTTLAALRGLC